MGEDWFKLLKALEITFNWVERLKETIKAWFILGHFQTQIKVIFGEQWDGTEQNLKSRAFSNGIDDSLG